MGTLHHISAKTRSKSSDCVATELAQVLRRLVDGRVGPGATFEQREKTALELTNEATRLCLQEDLQAIADSHGEEVSVQGRLYRCHEPGEVQYHSLCGPLTIRRWTYREVGVRNGPTIVPAELEAGLVERATPALAYSVALGYSKAPMRSYVEDMEAAGRCPPSRSTLERLGKRLGTEAKRATARIEPGLRASEHVPEQAQAIAIGLDRTTVPMEEDRQPGQAPTSRRKKRSKPRLRKKPPPVDVNYRMAYVGTIAITDIDGETLTARRYAVAAHEDPEKLVARLMDDLRGILRRAPYLIVGVIQDGAPEMWNLLRPALREEELVVGWYEAIDRYHLSERLARVLKLIEPDEHKRTTQLKKWERSLDRSDTAIDRIIKRIERVQDSLTRYTPAWKELGDELTYFGYEHMMRYACLRSVGLPVGSGVTEGACKSIITARTKRSGQRWRPAGLEAVLALRSLHQSDRLPRFWSRFARSYQAYVACA